jgi:hypothetical protein
MKDDPENEVRVRSRAIAELIKRHQQEFDELVSAERSKKLREYF